jgi:hypothetical protein
MSGVTRLRLAVLLIDATEAIRDALHEGAVCAEGVAWGVAEIEERSSSVNMERRVR